MLDGVARFSISDPFLGMPEEAWLPHRQFLTSDDELELALGGFVVRDGDRVILIDTGVGRVDSGPFKGGAFLSNLGALGVEPARRHRRDLHPPPFRPRRLGHPAGHRRVPQRHLPLRRAGLGPLRRPRSRRHAQAQPAGRPHGDVGRLGARVAGRRRHGGARAQRGSTIIVVSSKAERALLLGDVVHCPVELLDEEWAGMGDVDPELAKRTRNAMARELEGTDVPAAAAHFPGLQFGKLLAANGKRQWVID